MEKLLNTIEFTELRASIFLQEWDVKQAKALILRSYDMQKDSGYVLESTVDLAKECQEKTRILKETLNRVYRTLLFEGGFSSRKEVRNRLRALHLPIHIFVNKSEEEILALVEEASDVYTW